jgi:serine/threonine protein kinase
MKSKLSGNTIEFTSNLKLKLKDEIGEGSFSYVYTSSNPNYVVKLINQNDQKFFKSYQNEKFAYEHIGRHDNIISFGGCKENVNLKGVNHSCLALENCPKGSVINMIVNKKTVFTEFQILQIPRCDISCS